MTGPRRVSVVLAVYNAAWCIERALDSVFAQTRPVDEVVVCDDGSTDGTPDLVERRYGARVTVMRFPHRNASATRADGLRMARGEWLAFLDADDYWEPDKIERQLAFLDRHPDVRWMTTDGCYVSEEGVIRESWMADYFQPVREVTGDLFAALVVRCFPLMSSMLVERQAYDDVGGMDPTIVYSHDYDLWLRLGAKYPGAVMPERLVRYWWHPNQLSRKVEARYQDDLMLLERVMRGELRSDARAMALARRRAASHRFDLGLWALRAERFEEARAHLRGALDDGPPTRRVLAVLALLVPPALFPMLRRFDWIKRSVQEARSPVVSIEPGKEREP